MLMLDFLRTSLPGAARQPLTFLVSPRKAKQKKATARSRPLRGSQRCTAENGRVANSLRSNMHPSYPFSTAHHWPSSKRIRTNCSLRIALLAQYCRLAMMVDRYREKNRRTMSADSAMRSEFAALPMVTPQRREPRRGDVVAVAFFCLLIFGRD